MFETTIAANPDACRTEAEIADESGNRVAIVYEDSGGWHTEILDDRVEQPLTRFNALIENTLGRIRRCVRIENPSPRQVAVAIPILGLFSA